MLENIVKYSSSFFIPLDPANPLGIEHLVKEVEKGRSIYRYLSRRAYFCTWFINENL